jgi:hypothetical protein
MLLDKGHNLLNDQHIGHALRSMLLILDLSSQPKVLITVWHDDYSTGAMQLAHALRTHRSEQRAATGSQGGLEKHL